MFQLVCILLQAIACCTKRHLKQLFQVFMGWGGSEGVGMKEVWWQWWGQYWAKEESKWEAESMLSPPAVLLPVWFYIFWWVRVFRSVHWYGSVEQACTLLSKVEKGGQRKSSDFRDRKIKKGSVSIFSRDLLKSWTSQPVYIGNRLRRYRKKEVGSREGWPCVLWEISHRYIF